MIQEISALLENINLIVLIIAIPLAVFLSYKRNSIRNRIFTIKCGAIGEYYCELHLKIQNEKNKPNYNPHYTISKYLYKTDYRNKDRIKKAIKFLELTFKAFPEELIEKLEKPKIFIEDVKSFEKRVLTSVYKSEITDTKSDDLATSIIKTKQQVEDIKMQIITEALAYINSKNKKRQAIRLGYYFYTFLEKPDTKCKEKWIELWEKELGLTKGTLSEKELIANAFHTDSKNFTTSSMIKANKELRKFFVQINFHEAIEEIDLELSTY